MRLKSTLFSLLFLSFAFSAQAQIPSATVKTLDGQEANTADFSNDGKPMVISFWATWCKPCVKELNTINDVYEDWQDETGVKVIAISIDDARNVARVAPFVNGRSWEFEVFTDENSDFKRALNVVNVPTTFLINGAGEIVYTHTSFTPGDEEELYEHIQELVNDDE